MSVKTQYGSTQVIAACASHVEGVEAAVDYLVPGSTINRRYVAPGAELNTGRYAPHMAFIRNGRLVQGAPGLDTHGFVLAKQSSPVTNFSDKTEVDAVYPAEVERIVKALTGAHLVAPLGYVLRSSATTTSFPGRPGFSRFIASSLWRPFSRPPQDWPLAVCDGTSVGDDEGVPNVMVRLVTRDEVLLVKFHDSDHSKAWRTPHTSFRDPRVQNAPPRQSIESRTIAYHP